MTEGESVQQHEQLRIAAIAVLASVGNAATYTDEFRQALSKLHAAVRGHAIDDQDTREGPTPDPTAHLVSVFRYEGRTKIPIALGEEAAGIRRQLDAEDSTLADKAGRRVTLTELRAMIVGTLLEELAARLSPGPAFGPWESGRDLATVVTELSWELLDQTFVGRQ